MCWLCQICKQSFGNERDLSRHEKLVHMITHVKSVQGKKESIQGKKRSLPRNKASVHECDICGQTFKENKTLKYHRMIHTGEKPFHCDECGRSFRTPSTFRGHKKTHLKDSPASHQDTQEY